MFGIDLAQNVPSLVSIIVFLCSAVFTFGAWYVFKNDKTHDELFKKLDKFHEEFGTKYDAAIKDRNELKLEVTKVKTKLEMKEE